MCGGGGVGVCGCVCVCRNVCVYLCIYVPYVHVQRLSINLFCLIFFSINDIFCV